MIKLDIGNVREQVIGVEHGLNLTDLYQVYEEKLKKIVDMLWHNPDEEGSWRGWLNLGNDKDLANKAKSYACEIHGQFEHLVVIGIGGSSLGAMAMFEALLPSYWNERTFEQRKGHPKYYFVDNVDPDKLAGLLEVLDLKKTLINVITKSGTTAETMAGYLWLKETVERSVGKDNINRHIIITTDPHKGILRKIAQEEELKTFEVPSTVGGRFSVFSAVGILPAAIVGISIEDLQKGIRDLTPLLRSGSIAENPAAQGALIQYIMYEQGKHISVLMPYSAKLAFVADWYVQLWAESLGKKINLNNQIVHEGPTPLKAVGVTDQHSQVQLFNEGPFDKIFTFIRLEQFNEGLVIPDLYPDIPDLGYLGNKKFETLIQAEGDATRASLTKNQRVNMTITLPRLDAYHFAQLLFLLEVQTALMGGLLEVDPFDQPGVELAKQYTYALMGRAGFEHLKSEICNPAETINRESVSSTC